MGHIKVAQKGWGGTEQATEVRLPQIGVSVEWVEITNDEGDTFRIGADMVTELDVTFSDVFTAPILTLLATVANVYLDEHGNELAPAHA